MDPNFVRIYYVRYADDFVVSVTGPYKLALEVKNKIANFLKEKLNLILSDEKTKVTHFSKKPIFFLGAEILNRSTSLEKPVSRWKKDGKTVLGRVTPRLSLHAPVVKLLNRLKERGYVKHNSNGTLLLATARKGLVNLDHADIIMLYNAVILGIVNYYSFADNRSSLGSVVRLLQQSCALTLALKYKLRTAKKAFKKFGTLLKCPHTGKALSLPETLSRIRLFKTEVQKSHLDRVLRLNWSGKLTKTNLLKSRIICGDNKV